MLGLDVSPPAKAETLRSWSRSPGEGGQLASGVSLAKASSPPAAAPASQSDQPAKKRPLRFRVPQDHPFCSTSGKGVDMSPGSVVSLLCIHTVSDACSVRKVCLHALSVCRHV